MSDQSDLFGSLPHQSHSSTSRAGARRVSHVRATAQEKWVYETLQRGALADWQAWELASSGSLFDQLSSMRRARIGLVWVSRRIGATPYHPVYDTGLTISDPISNVEAAIWAIKDTYRTMPYETWVQRYKRLAKETR